jgi:hypothetical protein
MKLEGLIMEAGMKIEIPAAPVINYYISTFGTNLSAPVGQTGMGGTTALTYDSSDNLYASGFGYTGSIYQGITIKFNPDLTVNWQQQLSTGDPSDNIHLYSVSLDNSNNVYVTGTIALEWLTSTKSTTYQIAKYDTSGALQWQRDLGYGFTSFVPNFGKGIVVENSTSNLYVAGDNVVGTIGSQSTQMTVVKYNSSGAIQWAKVIGEIGTDDHCNSVALDSTGNVYLAGSTVYSGQNAAALVKYNSSGSLQWQTCLTGSTSSNANQFNSITIDSSNNIFVCGNTVVGSASVGIITKYNSSGNLLWQRYITLAGGIAVLLYGIAVDSSGNVYASGAGNIYNGYIVKYDTNGSLQWQRKVAGTHSTYGVMSVSLTSISFDSQDIMTIGGSIDQSTYNNMFIMKLPSDGTLIGTYEVNGITINYAVGDLTESALTFTSATPTMNSESINYLEAGPSSLTNSSSSFVDTVTQIP